MEMRTLACMKRFTAQNFFVKANLNLVRKGDRLNFKRMFRSGFRELEDDPFFRLVKNVVKILECNRETVYILVAAH